MSRRALAARLVELGAPPVVAEVDVREPGADEVLVRMVYASLNPLDTYVVAGAVGAPAERPRTLGVEGLGFHDGRAVVVHGRGLGVIVDGTWSGCVVAAHDALVPVPHGVDLAAASAAAVVGTTSIRVVRDIGRVDGNDRVLVLGAAGGVGLAIGSLCRDAGAQVWGQSASEDKAKAIADAGMSPVIAADPEQLIAEADYTVPTIVFDALGGGYTAAAVELLADYGRIVSYGTSADPASTLSMRGVYRKNLVVSGYGGVAEPPIRIREGTEAALQALADGSLVIPVHGVYPLAEVGAALAALRSRTAAGKVLLDVSDPESR